MLFGKSFLISTMLGQNAHTSDLCLAASFDHIDIAMNDPSSNHANEYIKHNIMQIQHIWTIYKTQDVFSSNHA